MTNRNQGVHHRLRNGLRKPIGLVTRLSSWKGKASSPSTKKFFAKRQRDVGTSTTDASEVERSLDSDSPITDIHRCTPSKEHCTSPTPTDEDDDDIGYQRFLEFLSSPSGSPSPFVQATSTTEAHDPITKTSSCSSHHTFAASDSNGVESYVVDLVDKFDQTLHQDEAEDASFSELDETSTSSCTGKDSSKQDVDSAMAWCALAAVLGCKAPSSITKPTSVRQKDHFWDMNTSHDDDIPDLSFDERSFSSIMSPTSEDIPDLNETSFDESDDEEDSLFIVPDIDIEDDQEFIYEELYKETSVKEAADSTLTWSALALLLGAPAPASVTKKTRKVWRCTDEDSNEVIPTLH